MEGTSLSNIPDIDRLRAVLSPIEQTGGPGVQPQTIKPDGTFVLESIQPGEYRVIVLGQPPNTFLKYVHLGQTDVSATLSLAGPGAGCARNRV